MKQAIFYKRLKTAAISLVVMCSITVATGCGSQRSATHSAPVAETSLASDADMARTLRNIVDSYGDWQRLRVPVTVELSQPKSVSISGTAIMERDKSIMIMLKYFGFEVGSLYLTDDSITVVDKIHKSYFKESVGKFLGGFNVSISNLQDLLVGRIFELGQHQTLPSSLSKGELEKVSSSEWLLIPKSKSSVSYGFRFNPADVLHALICQTGANPPVTCIYEPPQSTAVGPLSPAVSVNYDKGRTKIEARLEWNWRKVRWNSDVDLRVPSVGKDYKKISSADVSKLISNF